MLLVVFFFFAVVVSLLHACMQSFQVLDLIEHQYIKILTCVCLSVSDGSGMFVGRDKTIA